MKNRSRLWLGLAYLGLLLTVSQAVPAQVCLTSTDMDDATRAALTNTARKLYDMVARADTSALQQNSIPSVAANFSGIENAIKGNQASLSGGQATVRPPFLLKAEGSAPIERAEFLCGVFGSNGQTANSSIFVLSNLPPGTYGIVTLDVDSATPYMVSFVLQQQGNDWKLGGYYAKPRQAAGHDGEWFAARAREFKSKGQTRNAWFYFVEARDLLTPVAFMATQSTDKLFDEMQPLKPSDLPVDGPIDLTAGGKSYQLTTMFPMVAGSELDLVVKYQAADISNTAQTYQANVALIKALVAKYPELRDAFAGVVARAVTPSGQDYGSLVAMKDVK